MFCHCGCTKAPLPAVGLPLQLQMPENCSRSGSLQPLLGSSTRIDPWFSLLRILILSKISTPIYFLLTAVVPSTCCHISDSQHLFMRFMWPVSCNKCKHSFEFWWFHWPVSFGCSSAIVISNVGLFFFLFTPSAHQAELQVWVADLHPSAIGLFFWGDICKSLGSGPANPGTTGQNLW